MSKRDPDPRHTNNCDARYASRSICTCGAGESHGPECRFCGPSHERIPTGYLREKSDSLSMAVFKLDHGLNHEWYLNDIIDMATRLKIEAEKWLQVVKEREVTE